MNLSFFYADIKYCDFLRKSDNRVPYTFDEKKNRPFIGIIIEVDKFKYYAPLSSPKPKHMKMKNQIDFLKINEGAWGAINFNNMIPVQHEGFMKIDVNIEPTDPKHVADYKNLMKDQLTWCNSNKAVIVKKAV